jgi:2-polyprenyl-6-methoxyphenol hydroxylase-like FAD-dependent oxidoreductase
VEHPYKEGVVLIGDAAAANDPTFGQGLSLTVRDVRMLRDALLSYQDWDMAGRAYATERDRYYGGLHTVTRWWAQMFYEHGAVADARRARAFPLFAQDVTRIPDHPFSGPELPLLGFNDWIPLSPTGMEGMGDLNAVRKLVELQCS